MQNLYSYSHLHIFWKSILPSLIFIVFFTPLNSIQAQSKIIIHGPDKDSALIEVKTGDKYYDSGGPGGSRLPDQPGNYKNCNDPFNEAENCTSKYTFCAQGDTVSINFIEYLIVTGDRLRIFSGKNAIGATLFNSQTQGVSINGMRLTTGTFLKSKAPDGCITFEWFCTTIGNSIGWDADIIVNVKTIPGENDCKPVCRPLVQVILPSDTCFVKTSLDQYIIQKSTLCSTALKIFYPATSDQLQDLGFNASHVGKTFLYQAVDSISGATCTGYVSVKESPISQSFCKNDTLDCDVWSQTFAKLDKAITCDGVLYQINKTEFEPLDCSSNFIGKVYRQVERIDNDGNHSICQDTVFIKKMVLDSLTCPSDIHLSCSEITTGITASSFTPDYLSAHFDLNGDNVIDGTKEFILPLLNHHRIDSAGSICNTSLGFSDVLIPGCGNAAKIRRQWTIKNACAGKDSFCIQYIIIQDENAPILPEIKSLNYQTSGNLCKAEINVEEYQGIKDCSMVSQRIEIVYPDPNVPGKTIILNNSLPTKISLPAGGYSLKYTFSDLCFNVVRKDVCLTIAESSIPQISSSNDIVQYVKSNECKNVLKADQLNSLFAGSCCTKFHIAIAVSDSIQYYKNKWMTVLKNQCAASGTFDSHISFYNQWIDDWITSYVFKDSIDLTVCKDQKVVIRAYKICNLPARDPSFSCSDHHWYCYNVIPAYRSWSNLNAKTLNQCSTPFAIPCFNDFYSSSQDYRFKFNSDAYLNDSGSCVNDYLKYSVESSLFQFGEGLINVTLKDTITPLISSLPDLTYYYDGSKLNTNPNPGCCDGNTCQGEVYKPGTWPNMIRNSKDTSVAFGYYGGPIDKSAAYDINNYYSYPGCNEYDKQYLRPIYCKEALGYGMALSLIAMDSVFYKPVFNVLGHSKEFNITTPCEKTWLSKFKDSILTNECGQSKIIRSWSLIPTCGNALYPRQILNIIPRSNFEVIFPKDITLDCNENILDTTLLNKLTGTPKIVSMNEKSIKVKYQDSVVSGIGCQTVLRVWKVIDECFYNSALINNTPDIIVNDTLVANLKNRYCVYRSLKDDGNGIMEYHQIIQFVDVHAPEISIKDTSVLVSQNCTSPGLTLRPVISDDCTPSSMIQKKANLDIGSNLTIDRSFNFDSTITIAEGLPIGAHTLHIIVTDICGNKDSTIESITINDNALPQAFCISGQNLVAIPGSGFVDVKAMDFDAGSSAGCSTTGSLHFSFSQNIADSTRHLTCDSIGKRTFNIWVTNQSSQQSNCTLNVQINPSTDACITGIDFKVEGLVRTNQLVGISGVTVKTNLINNSTSTNALGFYTLNNLPKGKAISIHPERVEDPLNGVSTIDLLLIEKHIKGQTIITDPYLLIAADVNRSGTITAADLIELRKLILGMITTFSNTKSWLFVPKAYQFTDPSAPWTFPESIEYNPLNATMTDADFVGIKMGDINNSATLGLQKLEERSDGSNPFYFQYESTQHRYSLYSNVDMIDIEGLQVQLLLNANLHYVHSQNDQIHPDKQSFFQPFTCDTFKLAWTTPHPTSISKNRPLLTFESAATEITTNFKVLSDASFPSFFVRSGFKANNIAGIIPSQSEEAKLAIYPNPSNDNVFVKFYVNNPKLFKAYLTYPDGSTKAIQMPIINIGVNRILLTKNELADPGVYYFVGLDKGQIIKRMFIVL